MLERGGGVNIVFRVEDSRFHLVEGNNIFYLIPVGNRKKFESVSLEGVVTWRTYLVARR